MLNHVSDPVAATLPSAPALPLAASMPVFRLQFRRGCRQRLRYFDSGSDSGFDSGFDDGVDGYADGYSEDSPDSGSDDSPNNSSGENDPKAASSFVAVPISAVPENQDPVTQSPGIQRSATGARHEDEDETTRPSNLFPAVAMPEQWSEREVRNRVIRCSRSGKGRAVGWVNDGFCVRLRPDVGSRLAELRLGHRFTHDRRTLRDLTPC